MLLEEFNNLKYDDAVQLLFNCCGSMQWAEAVSGKRPFASVAELKTKADDIWKNCPKTDWLEAFTQHPEIGDMESLKKKFASTSHWASGEQSSVAAAPVEVLEQLKEMNRRYKEKYGYIFIICATGKNAVDMLASLQERMGNNSEEEIKIAAEEQRKIMHLRIDKLLA